MICIIKDKYPKALKHFLVLPKVKMATIYELEWFKHQDLLNIMVEKAKEHIVAKYPESKFKLGFHAIPSMAQVHMHVISQDFHSPCLKTKKHWNSFNTEYFVPCETVLNLLIKQGNCSSVQDANNRDKKELLGRDLQCNQCEFKPKNMPTLKTHL